MEYVKKSIEYSMKHENPNPLTKKFSRFPHDNSNNFFKFKNKTIHSLYQNPFPELCFSLETINQKQQQLHFFRKENNYFIETEEKNI